MTPTSWFSLGLLLLPAAAAAAPCAVPEGPPVALTLPLPIEPLDLQIAPAGPAWRVAWRVVSPSWVFVRDTDGLVALEGEAAGRLSRSVQAGASFALARDGRWVSFVDGGGEVQVQAIDAAGQPGEGSVRGARPTPGDDERSLAVASAEGHPWVVVERVGEAGTTWQLSSAEQAGRPSAELPFGVQELASGQAGEVGWFVWIDASHTLRSLRLDPVRYGTIAQGPTIPANAHGLSVGATARGPVVGWVDAGGAHTQQLYPHGGGAAQVDLGVGADALSLDASGAWAALRSPEGALSLRPAGSATCEAVTLAQRGVLGRAVVGSNEGRVIVGWTAPDANGVTRVWAQALSASDAKPATP